MLSHHRCRSARAASLTQLLLPKGVIHGTEGVSRQTGLRAPTDLNVYAELLYTTADSMKSISTPDGIKAVTGRHAAKKPWHAQVYGEAADPCEALTSQRIQEALPRLQRVRIVFVDDSMRTVPADYTVKARMSVRCVSRLTGELGTGSKGAFAQAHNAATAP